MHLEGFCGDLYEIWDYHCWMLILIVEVGMMHAADLLLYAIQLLWEMMAGNSFLVALMLDMTAGRKKNS